MTNYLDTTTHARRSPYIAAELPSNLLLKVRLFV